MSDKPNYMIIALWGFFVGICIGSLAWIITDIIITIRGVI